LYLAALCALAFGAFSSSASAQLQSPPGSAIYQSVTVPCPAGFQSYTLFNAEVVNAPQSVALRSIKWVGNPPTLKVTAEETDPVAENWQVSGLPGCFQNQPGNGFEFVYVSNTSPAGSAQTQSATVSCPPGAGNWGGGADITGGGPDVALKSLIPVNGAPQSWTATAEETDDVSSNWTVTAQAVCGYSDPGYIFSPPSFSAAGSPLANNAVDGCNGQHLPPAIDNIQTGGGDVVGGTPDVALRALKVIPSGVGNQLLWDVDAWEIDPTAATWQVASYGNCVPL
jgi:hypothetical protein